MPKLPQKTHRSNKADGEPLAFCSLCGCLVEAYRLVRSEVQGLRGHWICDVHKFEAEARSKPSYQDQGGTGQAGGGVQSDDEINPGAGSWWPGPVTGAKVDEVWVEVISDRAYEDGSQDGAIRVWRYAARSTPLTVYYTVSGTAAAGTDYDTLPGSIEILAGYQFATIPIVAKDDSVAEGDETVIVTLTANALYTVGTPNAGTVTIVSDDAAPTVDWFINEVYLEIAGTTKSTISLLLSSVQSVDVDVNFSLSHTGFDPPFNSGDPLDYYTITETSPVTIAAGDVVYDIEVEYYNAVAPGPNPTITFAVTTGTGYEVGVSTGASSTITLAPP